MSLLVCNINLLLWKWAQYIQPINCIGTDNHNHKNMRDTQKYIKGDTNARNWHKLRTRNSAMAEGPRDSLSVEIL